MESSTLAKLLIKDTLPAEQVEVPEQVLRVRESFPLNHMAPMIKRLEGKPSERVRVRRLIKKLQAEGFSISSYSSHIAMADWQLQESFNQAGEARCLVVKHREGDYSSPRSLEQLNYLQNCMQVLKGRLV